MDEETIHSSIYLTMLGGSNRLGEPSTLFPGDSGRLSELDTLFPLPIS